VVFGVRGEAGFVDFCDEKSKWCKFLQPPQAYIKGGGEVFKPVLTCSPILKEPLILVLKFLCELKNLVVSL
jgi:hypothetical protein